MAEGRRAGTLLALLGTQPCSSVNKAETQRLRRAQGEESGAEGC